MYIEDTNGVKYNSYSHELNEALLSLDSGSVRKFKIKYYSGYTSTKNIIKLVFSDFIRMYNSNDNSIGDKYVEKVEINI